MSNNFNNQKGSSYLLVLVAALGLLIGILLVNITDFKSPLFQNLYPKPVSEAKVITTRTKTTQVADNRFIFEFNNQVDASGWVAQIDPPSENYKGEKIIPTTKGIQGIKAENGYLKFKVTSNNAVINSPQNLNIKVATLQNGGYSQTSGKYFMIGARSDGKGTIEQGQDKTGGVHVVVNYHDDQNAPGDLDLDKWFQSMPIPKTSTQFAQSRFEVFNGAQDAWGDFNDPSTFLGTNAYIKGFSFRFTNLKGNEIWLDYAGFYDKFPKRGS